MEIKIRWKEQQCVINLWLLKCRSLNGFIAWIIVIRCQIDSIKTIKTVLVNFATSVVTGVTASTFQYYRQQKWLSQANIPTPCCLRLKKIVYSDPVVIPCVWICKYKTGIYVYTQKKLKISDTLNGYCWKMKITIQ